MGKEYLDKKLERIIYVSETLTSVANLKKGGVL